MRAYSAQSYAYGSVRTGDLPGGSAGAQLLARGAAVAAHAAGRQPGDSQAGAGNWRIAVRPLLAGRFADRCRRSAAGVRATAAEHARPRGGRAARAAPVS